jgi:hypothetical protein
MMKLSVIKNRCKQIRSRLGQSLGRRLDLNTGWLQSHIAGCPRCQRRIINIGNVDIALSLLKSQPHSVDLLMNANSEAIKVLKHSLRNAPKANKLRELRPEPNWFQRHAKPAYTILNAAACIMIILLVKTGAYASMTNLHEEGEVFVQEYYAKHLGQDYADEIFHS